MDLLISYSKIRCRQAFRLLKDAGWFNLLLLSPIAFVALLTLLEKSLDGAFPAMALVFLATVLSIHFQRKDSDFLERLGYFPFVFRWIDYSLLSIPFLISLLVVACFRDLVLILLALPLLALLPMFRGLPSFRSALSLDFLPIEAMEWRSALRKLGWWLLLLYVVALAACQEVFAGIGITLLLALMVVGFYDDLEEKELLEVFLPVDRFLWRKAYWQGSCFHGLLLPHYLLFLILHGTYWYLLLAAILIAQSLLCFGLFYKYAQWRPQQFKAYNQMALGLYTGGLLIPFLAPASLFYCWKCYHKAKSNIAYYYGRNK